MPKEQRIHCSLCGVQFCTFNRLFQTEDATNIPRGREATLPGELVEWTTELRFIEGISGVEGDSESSALRFSPQSRDRLLKCGSDHGDYLTVYRFSDAASDTRGGIHNGHTFRAEGDVGPDIILFPIHSQCINLLWRLRVSYKLTSDDVWRILSEDLGNDNNQKMNPSQQIMTLNQGGLEEWHLANPINIPSLTEYILSLLRPLTPVNHHTQHHQYHQRSPSPEFSSSVCYANYDRHHIPNHHDQQEKEKQEQQHYRDELISGTRIPYLWDINVEACIHKDHHVNNDSDADKIQIWDWIGLVENLTQVPETLTFGNDDSGAISWEGAPIGLKNRCRIWDRVRRQVVGNSKSDAE